MFSLPQPRSTRRRASLLASIVIHCGVVYLWLHRAPVFVKPSSAAYGRHGQTENVTYFPAPQALKAAAKKTPPRVGFRTKAGLSQEEPENTTARAGTEHGSVGSVSRTEARPSLPLVFPVPAVFPRQVAQW